MNSLKNQSISGARWMGLSSLSTAIIEFGRLAILARILGPEAYGLMAMVVVVTGVGGVVSKGLPLGIIPRKEPTKEELSSMYWLNIFVGILIYLVLFVSAPLVAFLYGETAITPLLRVSALTVIIAPLGWQFQIILQKYLNFKTISKIEIAKIIVGAIIAIILALAGWGVWALVFGGVGTVIFETGLLAFAGLKAKYWRPHLYFRLKDTHGYLSFGLFRASDFLLNSFISRVDQMVIGGVMGAVPLGYYNIACNITSKPNQKVVPIMNTVAFPVFSAVQDDLKKLRNGFFKMVRLLSSVISPISIGLAVVAPLAVPLLLGGKWLPTIPIVQILSFYVLILALEVPAKQLANSKGKANWLFYWSIVILLVVPVTVYLVGSLKNSILYVAIAMLILRFVLFLFLYPLFIKRLLGACFVEYAKSVFIPVVLASVMGIMVSIVNLFFGEILPVYRLLLLISIGMISYCGLLYLFQKKLFYELVDIVPPQVKIKVLA